MKYTSLILALAVLSAAAPHRGNGGGKNPAKAAAAAPAAPAAGGKDGGIDPSLVPDFGITPGIPSADQPGSCQGNNNVNIPCKCPPSKDAFIAVLNKFNAAGNVFGSPFNFDTNAADQSAKTKLARVNAAIVGFQNFDQTAQGVGCPAGGAAPNFLKEQAALQKQI